TVRGVLYGSVRGGLPLGDRAVQAALEAARELEQRLTVRDEVDRRLESLMQPAPEAGQTPPRELVREAYAELRMLASDLDGPGLRDRVDAICRKLVPSGAPDGGVQLAARELDVLACVALGWTNAHVATDLD